MSPGAGENRGGQLPGSSPSGRTAAPRALRWSLWLVRRICDRAHVEEVEGDLLEIATLRDDPRLPLEPGARGRARWHSVSLLREALSAAKARPSAALRRSARYGVLFLLVTGLTIVAVIVTRGNPEPPIVPWLVGLGLTFEFGIWYLVLRGTHHG